MRLHRRPGWEFFDDESRLEALVGGGPIQPYGIASTSAVGTPILVNAIQPVGIASTSSVGAPNLQTPAGDLLSGAVVWIDDLAGQVVWMDELAGEARL